MSARLLALIAHDARMQYRYGIYAAYSVVIAFYAAALTWGAPYLPDWAPAAIIFSDPAALGFFFLGALMMLERAESTRAALAATPVSALDYFVSKLVTLQALALTACIVLLLVRHRDNAPLLLLAVVLTGIQYIGIGVLTAYLFKTVNGYLIGSSAFLTPIVAPGMLGLLDPFPGWLVIIPAVSQFRLFMAATGSAAATAIEIAIMLAVCLIAAALASWFAVARLEREFGK